MGGREDITYAEAGRHLALRLGVDEELIRSPVLWRRAFQRKSVPLIQLSHPAGLKRSREFVLVTLERSSISALDFASGRERMRWSR